MDSPPSASPYSNSPVATPEYIREQRREIKKKELFIELVLTKLEEFPNEALIDFFSGRLKSDMALEKKYRIAEAIEAEIKNFTLNDKLRAEIMSAFKKAIFQENSSLYRSLNYQQSIIFRFTLFGPRSRISWNYARSLQMAQTLVLEEQQNEPGF